MVYSEPYRNRIAVAKFRSSEYWTGLGAETRAKLAQVIGGAVADGQNPKAARKLILEAPDVSKGRAMLYAQTDITSTLREARWQESEYADRELGIRTALLWTSAFLPTARRTHAVRHGHTYSPEKCREFYSKDGNRYRCHCGQTECLLNTEGEPILTGKLRDIMKNERSAWISAHSAAYTAVVATTFKAI